MARCLKILTPMRVGMMLDGQAKMVPEVPLIITRSQDSNIRVWKLPMPRDKPFFPTRPSLESECPYFVRTLKGHHESVRAIAAHADTLISGSYDCTIRVWKTSMADAVHCLQGHTQKVYSVVLNHKRNRCISGSVDNLVKI
jgi:F-box and WD-40 domain protein CDC4